MYSKLKSIRLENNKTQKEVASILNIAEITYTHYESEYYIMPIKYIVEVCNFFEVSLDYLFDFVNTRNYNNVKENIDIKVLTLRLKEFRKENNLTQAKLAEILCTTQSNIAEYERGTNIIATPYLYTICKKYKISADYLLGRTDEPKYLK